MTRRRQPGEGCISAYATSAGTRYLIKYRVPDASSKSGRKAVLRRGFATRAEAARELRTALSRVDNGTHVEPSKTPVAVYLVNEWLPTLRTRASTRASYEKNVRLHVVPYIGNVPLSGLTSTHLNALYRQLESTGRKDGRAGGLSPRTVRYVHTILHRALADAVNDGRLAINPADRSRPPSAAAARAPEMQTWTSEQLRTFLEWCVSGDDAMQPAWLLLAMTGIRRGELLALRWRDVDFDGAALRIRRSVGVVKRFGDGESLEVDAPKSGRMRSVDCDTVTLAALRAHRLRAAEIDLGRVREDSLVFSTVEGQYLHPERFSREWSRRMTRFLAERPDGRRIRLHDLRHTHATLLLQAGVHPKIVSERLGHSKVSITLDVYSHALPTLQKEAASRLSELVFA